MSGPLLRVEGLEVHFPTTRGTVRAVDGVSFDLQAGETLGLVGESGCGKSTTARGITRLLDPTGGRVLFEGNDLAHATDKELRATRQDMQMIFQDPYASLDPRMTVRDIIAEPIQNFRIARGKKVRERVWELLERVGLDPGFDVRYPHEFSGGQRQRIGVARALAVNPTLILCDEPVSALDVSIQAQVVNLLEDLQSELGLAYLFISHDLSVVRHVSDRIAVMYLGRIVELAPSRQLYDEPMHPYTEALLSAVPIPDPEVETKRERIVLEGDIPSPTAEIVGCPFRARCAAAFDRCAVEAPELKEYRPGHEAACFLHDE
ncbi:MAG: ABC transporter ATP-binding protein [Planctomycetota bacterium]|jgi:oligopeptide transport system ATP-binding protein